MPHPPRSSIPNRGPRHRHPQPRRSLTVAPSLPTSSHELGAWKEPEREAGRGGDARSVALGARATLDRAHPRLQLGGQGSTAARPRPLSSHTLSPALSSQGSQEEPRLPVSTGIHQYPLARRCSNPAVASGRQSTQPRVLTARSPRGYGLTRLPISTCELAGPLGEPGVAGHGDWWQCRPASCRYGARGSALRLASCARCGGSRTRPVFTVWSGEPSGAEGSMLPSRSL